MIKKNEVKMIGLVGLGVIGAGYVMAMLQSNPIIAQARRGLGG